MKKAGFTSRVGYLCSSREKKEVNETNDGT